MRVRPLSPTAIVITLSIVLVALSAAAVAAQGTGQIEGVARDEQGLVLPGSSMTLKNEDTGITRTVVSGTDGRYVFPALLPGRYTLRAELSGFATQEVRGIVIPSVSSAARFHDEAAERPRR